MKASSDWVRRLVVAMGAAAALVTIAGCGDDEITPPKPATPPTLKMTATDAP
jgi:hypothetical protein